MRHPVTWLDVFTSTPLTGNQLAVVHDTHAIDDARLSRASRASPARCGDVVVVADGHVPL